MTTPNEARVNTEGDTAFLYLSLGTDPGGGGTDFSNLYRTIPDFLSHPPPP